jgi:uncharacterized protein (TIGR03086 family)
MMTIMDLIDYYAQASSTVIRVVSAVRDDQLGLPTPCPEWNVRTVINHIALGGARVAAWMLGQPAPGWETDYLGADFKADVTAAAARAGQAFGAPGALDLQVQAAFGPAPGNLLVRMIVNEFLTHGWDVADATGQSTDLAPEIAELALADSLARFGGVPRVPGGPFGPERSAPADATAADRLAAFLGRRRLGSGDGS